MTWSIVARDPRTGAYGVAVTTCAFAVGARVPYGCGRVGAIATQSFVNPFFGVDGLQLLKEGRTAAETLAILVAADPGASNRQAHVVDRDGEAAVFTGADCVDWRGSLSATGVSVAGNMLAGPAVVDDSFAAYDASAGQPFAERLIGALDAGQAAGGDKRGRQSAALLVYSGEDIAEIDLRVDDHPEPLVELRRLLGVYYRDSAPFRAVFPTRARPSGIYDPREIEAMWATNGRAVKFDP
jgi:uncharacterized Ntn-hydrolase superfamily protein